MVVCSECDLTAKNKITVHYYFLKCLNLYKDLAKLQELLDN